MEEVRIECPVCGANDAKEEVVTLIIQEPYGSAEQFSFTVTKCTHCDESVTLGDYDTAVVPARNKSIRASVICILKFFEENKYNTSALERIFGLSRGTINRYLAADVIEPSFVMLLLTYRTFFPGLIDFADLPKGFNRCTFFGEKDKYEQQP
jgi:hypothetical protein